jgi:hypothetical protein
MSDRDAVIFVNEAFYMCFAAGDADGMDDLWAKAVSVTCIHPGGGSLVGRTAVVDSWRNIITAGAPQIRCREPEVSLYGDTASVICFEELKGEFLIATNVFVREEEAWKMVHHQAGPTRGQPSRQEPANENKSIN